MKPNTQSKDDSLTVYKRLVKVALPYWLPFCVGQLGNALIAASDAILTYSTKVLMERGFTDRDGAFITMLPIMVLGFFLSRGLSTSIASYFMAWVGHSVVRDFRTKIVRHLMVLPSQFYDTQAPASLLSKIYYDVEQVSGAICDASTSAVRGVFTLMSMIVVMLVINWRVTVMAMVILPILALYLIKSSKKMRSLSVLIEGAMGKVMHVATEIISNHKIICIFASEDIEKSRFVSAARNTWRHNMRMVSTGASTVAGMQFIGACALATFLYFSTLKDSHIMGTAMGASDFMTMGIAILGLLRPIKQISVVNTNLQRGISAAKSIFGLLDEAVEPNHGKLILSNSPKLIEFRQVKFNYPNHEEKVLKGVSFSVARGESIALVGRSGSGKSTIVSLISRFYDIQSGSILIDDINIDDIEIKSLRSQLSLVSQHVLLFNDTIANNIAYGCDRVASLAEIEEAAKLAYAYEFIEKLPKKFDSEIGENGALLSGGQRQRIAIARAILKNTPILILDEATSALDAESERHIQLALDNLMKDKTTIVIAHRLSTIQKANKILLIDKGKIKESGSHQELMSIDGQYAALYRAHSSPHEANEK